MAKLGNICTNQSSNIKQSDLENNNGSYPIYGASGLIKNVDFYKQEKPYVAIVKDGAGVGRVMQLPAYSSVIGTMQYIIPNDDTDVKYLAYAMEHMNLAKYYSGATIPHIYFKDYKNEYIKGHNIETQKKIATTLDKVTHTIDTCNAILEKLDLLVKSQFVEMFGSVYEERFDTITIPQFASKDKNSIKRGPFGGTLKKEDFVENGYLVYEQRHAIHNDFQYEKYFITREKYESMIGFKVVPGDLIISCSGVTLGRIAEIPNGAKEGIINQALLKLSLDKTKMMNAFFIHQFRSEEIQDILFGFSRGSGIPNMPSMSEVKAVKFICPPLELQQQFADFVQQNDKTKQQVKMVLEKAETLKKALMQEYFG